MQQSPYTGQGDIGFFSYNNKQYGQFFCVINTFTKKLFAIPIANTKAETLMNALEKMKKVKFAAQEAQEKIHKNLICFSRTDHFKLFPSSCSMGSRD